MRWCVQVLRYKEEFAAAAESFKRASDLDPSLPGEEALEGILQRVRRTVDLLEKKVCGTGEWPSAPGASGRRGHDDSCPLHCLCALPAGASQGEAPERALVLSQRDRITR